MKRERKPIQDEFSHLAGTVSRQRILQFRWKRDGFCTICGKPRHPASATFCEKHHLAQRKYIRAHKGYKCTWTKPDSEIACRNRVAAALTKPGLVDAWH